MQLDNLDFIEAKANQLVAFSLDGMELLNKRAHTLITLQLGGGGALAVYAAGLLERAAPVWLLLGVAAAAAMLVLLAGLGAWACLFTRLVLPPGNSPRNLLPLELTLPALRHGELLGLQLRMDQWAAHNRRVGLALNVLYAATAAVPLLASALAWVVR